MINRREPGEVVLMLTSCDLGLHDDRERAIPDVLRKGHGTPIHLNGMRITGAIFYRIGRRREWPRGPSMRHNRVRADTMCEESRAGSIGDEIRRLLSLCTCTQYEDGPLNLRIPLANSRAIICVSLL